VKVWHYAFLALTTQGYEWSTSHPCRFYLRGKMDPLLTMKAYECEGIITHFLTFC